MSDYFSYIDKDIIESISASKIVIPKYAGYWQHGKAPFTLRLAITYKPKWITRKLVKWLLEIEWFDLKEGK